MSFVVQKLDKSSQDKLRKSSRTVTKNKRFRDNEARFNEVLCGKMSKRCMNVRPKDFYELAGLTPPTFYLHYQNSNEVRTTYENNLEEELDRRISANTRKVIVLTVLPIFIVRNQEYFLAAHRGSDHHLLTKIIVKYRYNLVDKEVSDRSFYTYVGAMVTTITCWLEFDELNDSTMKRCTDDLMGLPIREVEG